MHCCNFVCTRLVTFAPETLQRGVAVQHGYLGIIMQKVLPARLLVPAADEESQRARMQSVSEAFELLWSARVSHGDVALRNLAFDARRACLLDFGRAEVHSCVEEAKAADARDVQALLQAVGRGRHGSRR